MRRNLRIQTDHYNMQLAGEQRARWEQCVLGAPVLSIWFISEMEIFSLLVSCMLLFSRQEYLNKKLYTNEPTKDYFCQFNTTSR